MHAETREASPPRWPRAQRLLSRSGAPPCPSLHHRLALIVMSLTRPGFPLYPPRGERPLMGLYV